MTSGPGAPGRGRPATSGRASGTLSACPWTLADLPADVLAFLRERHLATLTTLRPDGSPHVVPVGFTWDDEAKVARVITSGPSRKARNALAGGRAVLAQVDGRRWLALEGPVRVLTDGPPVREAEERYAARYRTAAGEPGPGGAADQRRPGARQRLTPRGPAVGAPRPVQTGDTGPAGPGVP